MDEPPSINLVESGSKIRQSSMSPSTETIIDETTGSHPTDVEGQGVKSNKSMVWDHFTKLPLIESQVKGKRQAKCNYCQKRYQCDSTKDGTNSLNRHLHRVHNWLFSKAGKKETIHNYMTRIEEGDTLLGGRNYSGYNLEDCRKAVAEFVISDEMPFKVVEGRGFRKLVNRLEPRFVVPSRFTISRDCYQLFLDEKKKLKSWLSKSCNRICMTTDCWTSNQNFSYMCLTGHFIDEDWTLQKRILNFRLVENHKGETIGREIETCLRDWSIERVFTITVDNASSNDAAISYLRKKLDARGGLVCGGKYLHMRCCAHILNLIVSDGIKEQQSSIDGIRNAVRYVRSSPQRLKRFKECIEAELIASKSLVCLDVPTRWNSTYIMLEHAEKYEKAFDRLSDQELDYRKWFSEDEKGKKRVGPPTNMDWQNSRIFIQFLQLFHEMTLGFSRSLHVTSTDCYHEIASVQSSLTSWGINQSELLGSMACSMRAKYDKYWGSVEKFNPLLFVAVVLDPRYKYDYVVWSLEDTYDREMAAKMTTLVKATLTDLYEFYAKGIRDIRGNEANMSILDSANTPISFTKSVNMSDIRKQAWKKHKIERSSFEKSDLERYLEDNVVDDVDNSDFDILSWWKTNATNYKGVAAMAQDILAIPVSSVASESCFSTSGRILDVFRSSLSPRMAEALVCSQNWLNPIGCKLDDKDFDMFDTTDGIIEEITTRALGSNRGCN